MKKQRFLSALTSIAMIGSAITGALSFTASAADTKPTTMAMGMTAPKTEYYDGEYESGFTQTVSIVINNYDDADKCTTIKGNVTGPDGVTLSNMKVVGSKKSPITTGENAGKQNYFTKSKGSGYTETDFYQTGVSANDTPGFIMQGTGVSPFIKNQNPSAGPAIFQFDATFAANLAPGKYTINFLDVEANDSTLLDTVLMMEPSLTPITFTLGGTATPTEPTEPPTQPTQPTKPTGERNDYNFVGNVDITLDTVEVQPGDTATVKMYADTHGYDLEGVGFRYIWDNGVSLVNGSGDIGLGFLCSPAGTDFEVDSAVNGKATYVAGTPGIMNDPEDYVVSFDFKVPDTAKIGDVYEISITGPSEKGDDMQFTVGVNAQDSSKFDMLKPVIKTGKIKVVAPVVTTTTAAPTTAATTTTTAAPVTEAPKPTTVISNVISEVTVPVVSEVTVVSVSNVISEVTVVSVSVSKEVSISISAVEGEIVTVPVASEVTVVSVSNVISEVTVVSVSVSKEVSVSTVVSISISAVEGEIVTVPVASEVTVVSVSVSKEVSVSTVVSISISAVDGEIVTVPVASEVTVPVASEVTVPVISEVTVTVTVTVTVPVTTTTSAVVSDEGPTFTVDASKLLQAGDNSQWYHTDDSKFVSNGIVVLDMEGNDITDLVEIKCDKTPAGVYDSKKHTEDYSVEFTVTLGGEEQTIEVPVKIGVRGDSKISSAVDVFDAVRIAQATVGKVKIAKGSFDAFRTDANESGAVDVFDAVAIAKFTVASDKTPEAKWKKIITGYDKMHY